MDTLTFGATKMLKHLTFSEQKKMPVHEVDLQKVLAGFEMSMDQVSLSEQLDFSSERTTLPR